MWSVGHPFAPEGGGGSHTLACSLHAVPHRDVEAGEEMKSLKVWIRAAAGVTALALTLGGTSACGGSKTPSGSAATSAPATTGANAGAGAAPVKSEPATTTPPAAPVLADGRSAVYLTGLDTAAKTTTFDL